MAEYSATFYSAQEAGSRRSAEAVVPLVMERVKPRSVVDVGCGVGAWLSVFEAAGVTDILGIDGSYVDREQLCIDPERFRPHDLTQPLETERTFDLVVSLEVAEHLPPSCAEPFVESLTRLGPAVLFSAAIPYQGGKHHVNEQWPEYWADLFAARGYEALDCIRPVIWDNPDVDWCYAQNVLLYSQRDPSATGPIGRPRPLSLVHPRKYLEQVDPEHITLRNLGRWLPAFLAGVPKILRNTVRRRSAGADTWSK